MFFLQLSKFIMTSRFRRFMTQRLCSALRALGLVYGCCSGCRDGRAVSGEGLYRCSCCVPVVTSSMTTLGNALRTLDQCILEKKIKRVQSDPVKRYRLDFDMIFFMINVYMQRDLIVNVFMIYYTL